MQDRVRHVPIWVPPKAVIVERTQSLEDALKQTMRAVGVAVRYVETSCLAVNIHAKDPATRVFVELARWKPIVAAIAARSSGELNAAIEGTRNQARAILVLAKERSLSTGLGPSNVQIYANDHSTAESINAIELVTPKTYKYRIVLVHQT